MIPYFAFIHNAFMFNVTYDKMKMLIENYTIST